MLKHELSHNDSILIVRPEAPLEAKDFEELYREIDLYIKETGKLHGLMIYTESFPGWDNFAAFLSHIKFIKKSSPENRKSCGCH